MERPANVPEAAIYDEQKKQWDLGEKNEKGEKTGLWKQWHANGNLVVKRLYNETGKVVESYEYDKGVLKTSTIYDADGLVRSFYNRNVDPPVIEERIVFRNNEKDAAHSFFDETGKLLYSIRSEEVTKFHSRRYYNGKLVYEGILAESDTQPPVSIKYYAENGATLIDYTSNGDNTGVWRLYDATGNPQQSMPVPDEQANKKRIHWEVFLNSWSGYSVDYLQSDWEAIVANFHEANKNFNAENKLNAPEIPAYLQQELDKVNWKDIETAMGGGEELPTAINGMLCEDEDVANMSSNIIWFQIEHLDSVYEATCQVANILARMLPLYNHLPVVQLRLCNFLYDVLKLYYINTEEKMYEKLITAIDIGSSLPLIMQWANDADEKIARKAQYLLVLAGKIEEAEPFLMQEWQNTAHPRVRRGYAIFSLGAFYTIRKENKKLVEVFSAVFNTETDSFLRFALAVQLVLATREKAEDKWLAETLVALANPEPVSQDFFNMRPFIGYSNVQIYSMTVLGKANPQTLAKTLAKNIEPVIDALPMVNSQVQATHLRAIFAILFEDVKSALENITPVRKKALLAAANVVLKDPDGFINHKEVFDAYGLPHDGFALIQLAKAANS